MTDEMTIQGQRPSAMPYVLGGATVGAGGGYFGSQLVKTKAYESWEDAVKEATDKDSFVSKQIEKGGDNKTAWEKVKTNAAAVQKAVAELEAAKIEGIDGENLTKLEDYAKKQANADVSASKLAEAATKVEEAAKKEKANVKFQEIENALVEDIKKNEGGKFDNKFKRIAGFTSDKEGEKLGDAISDLGKWGRESRVLQQGYVEELESRIKAANLEGDAKAYAEAEIARIKAAVTSHTDAKAAETAKNVFETAVGDKKPDAAKLEKFVNATKAVVKANNTAKEELTNDLLGNLKKGGKNKWLWAGIGAAALALGALAIRPKGEDV